MTMVDIKNEIYKEISNISGIYKMTKKQLINIFLLYALKNKDIIDIQNIILEEMRLS